MVDDLKWPLRRPEAELARWLGRHDFQKFDRRFVVAVDQRGPTERYGSFGNGKRFSEIGAALNSIKIVQLDLSQHIVLDQNTP